MKVSDKFKNHGVKYDKFTRTLEIKNGCLQFEQTVENDVDLHLLIN